MTSYASKDLTLMSVGKIAGSLRCWETHDIRRRTYSGAGTSHGQGVRENLVDVCTCQPVQGHLLWCAHILCPEKGVPAALLLTHRV